MKSIPIAAALMAAAPLLGACGNIQTTNTKNENTEMKNEKTTTDTGKRDTIYFAGGCFWGTEHFMKQIDGVTATEAGYANSRLACPSYRQVCTGSTGAAETVEVVYDPSRVSLRFLIDLYLMTIDPTSLNRQGNDVGTQYRTGIYYTDAAQKAAADEAIARIGDKYTSPIAVEVRPLENFYPAEDYHQDYLTANPRGYCHLSPRLFEIARNARDTTLAGHRYARPDDSELRERLTPVQYEVTQHSATEPPFRNEYWDNRRQGIYVDITTGQPLFVSTDKFDSGCGWPSFSRPLPDAGIVEKTDNSHGMVRTEVRSGIGDAHLGHVFDDGPAESGGLRYCINSASLRFVPLEQMAGEGYGGYVRYVK